MTTTSESRLNLTAETAPKMRVTAQSQDIEAPRIPHLSAVEIEASRPTYALLVKSPTGRISRRLYLSLHSAVKATERAQARGHAVSLELVRLVPYVTGADLHGEVMPGE